MLRSYFGSFTLSTPIVIIQYVFWYNPCHLSIQAMVILIDYDGIGPLLEINKIIDDFWAIEGRAIIKLELIDYHGRSIYLYVLYHLLNRVLTEIIAVVLHSQTIHTDNNIHLLVCFIAVYFSIIIGFFKRTVSIIQSYCTISNIISYWALL